MHIAFFCSFWWFPYYKLSKVVTFYSNIKLNLIVVPNSETKPPGWQKFENRLQQAVIGKICMKYRWNRLWIKMKNEIKTDGVGTGNRNDFRIRIAIWYLLFTNHPTLVVIIIIIELTHICIHEWTCVYFCFVHSTHAAALFCSVFELKRHGT